MENTVSKKTPLIKKYDLVYYGVFALVSLFLVWQTVDFISANLLLLSGRFIGRFDTITSVLWLELRYLLKLFYGFLLLPLCLPASKKKVLFADIALIAFGLAIILFGPKLSAFLNGTSRLTWAGWVVLLTIVPIVNIFGKSPRSSFKDYCKGIFNLSLKQKDKWTGAIVFILFLWGEYRLLRAFQIVFLSSAKLSMAAAVLECILASIVIVLLFAAIASAIVPSYRGKEAGKRVLALSIAQICLVFIYLLSWFVHTRWISYASLAFLLAISLFALRKDVVSLFKDRR